MSDDDYAKDLVMRDEILALRAENARLREALEDIAKQMTGPELDRTCYGSAYADWETGYHEMVKVARAALSGEVRAEPHK